MFFFGKKKNKKPQAEISHYCFITEEGKWKNLLATLKERQGLGTLWILTHFEQTMADFQTKLDELGITYEEKRHRFGELVICLAKDVSTSISNASEVWCLEEHPLHSEKEALLEKLAEYGVKELKVFLGLDEQIFESFNEGNRIGQMMSRMAMSEDEIITHPMISKSITNIQKKIEKRHDVVVHTTTSQEDWFSANQLRG